MKATIHFDGGARPTNPGPAAGAAIVKFRYGPDRQGARYLGEQTNNFAEYAGLSLGLDIAHAGDATSIEIITDSKLIEGHLTMGWKVSSDNLAPALEYVRHQLERFPKWKITRVSRQHNSEADALATKCILQGKSILSTELFEPFI